MMFKKLFYGLVCTLVAMIGNALEIEGQKRSENLNGLEGKLVISDLQSFFALNREQVSMVKELYFEGISLSSPDDFRGHWRNLRLFRHLDVISFHECSFLGDSLWVFSNLWMEKLLLPGCSLTSREVDQILSMIYPYDVSYIDLSNNLLGDDKKRFLSSYFKYVLRGVISAEIIINGNDGLCLPPYNLFLEKNKR